MNTDDGEGESSMKISVQTCGTVNRLGIDAGMKAIADAGFDAVDLDLDAHYKWEDLKNGIRSDFFDDDKIYPYLDGIKAAAEKYGLEIGQAHAPAPLYVHESPAGSKIVQDDVRRSIELCEYVGCTHLVVHPLFHGGTRFPAMTKEEEYAANIEFFTSIIPLLKKHGVVCCLENMWGEDWRTKKIYTAICSDINETIKYIDELNAFAGEKRFGFCLDVGHLLLLGQDPCYWAEKLGERLVLIHTHDNDGVNDEHIIPYLGVCNWDRFVIGLRKNGFKGNLDFETSTFNDKFPKELIPAALNISADVARHLAGRITAETYTPDKYR